MQSDWIHSQPHTIHILLGFELCMVHFVHNLLRLCGVWMSMLSQHFSNALPVQLGRIELEMMNPTTLTSAHHLQSRAAPSVWQWTLPQANL